MQDWSLYTEGKQTNIPYNDADQIVKALPKIYSPFLSNLDTKLSNKLKFILLKLGYQLGYCGYANITKSKVKNQLVSLLNKEIDTYRKKFDFRNHSFRNMEWLYDIHWYRDKPDTHFMPETLHMACESELNKRRDLKKGEKEKGIYHRPGVRYDFQKLLVTNALLKVMIFKIDKPEELLDPQNGLSDYFINAIEAYKQLPTSSKFLFACLYERCVYYRYYEKIGE